MDLFKKIAYNIHKKQMISGDRYDFRKHRDNRRKNFNGKVRK